MGKAEMNDQRKSQEEKNFLMALVVAIGLACISSAGTAAALLFNSAVVYLHTGVWSPMNSLEVADLAITASGGDVANAWNNWIGLQNSLRSTPAFLSAFLGSVALLWMLVGVMNLWNS
ncbi:hypothetical protein [Rhizobium binae]|uniref:hypothetical protein n=1 Tax=Rhizobium binae TaxID=1138190 RepID=UPI001C839F4E|nr:hypothetical protein [Rhizobium binae]MBX4941008.1 hypothetical protein [Rhizobium binae]MBX4942413.1 hypothetical protein [Rhizobium binae]MBX4982134.1 hypothetical protein [Rhizobium binae]